MLGALTFFPYPPGLERSPQAYRTLAQTRLTWNPFAIYQPASSSVGMYQMTDAAFAEARHYCIRNHIVVVDGCSLPGSILGHYRAAPSSLRQCFLDRKSRRFSRARYRWRPAHSRNGSLPQ
jgi:hypothetical protein